MEMLTIGVYNYIVIKRVEDDPKVAAKLTLKLATGKRMYRCTQHLDGTFSAVELIIKLA